MPTRVNGGVSPARMLGGVSPDRMLGGVSPARMLGDIFPRKDAWWHFAHKDAWWHIRVSPQCKSAMCWCESANVLKHFHTAFANLHLVSPHRTKYDCANVRSAKVP